MNDNQDGPMVTYAFTLAFKVGGVVDSRLTTEATREKLSAELSDFYGPDGYEILDFHEATPDEVMAYKNFMMSEEDEDVTIN